MKTARVQSLLMALVFVSASAALNGCGDGKKSRTRNSRILKGSEGDAAAKKAAEDKKAEDAKKAGEGQPDGTPADQTKETEEEAKKKQDELAKQTEAFETITSEFDQLVENSGAVIGKDELAAGTYTLVEASTYIAYQHLKNQNEVRASSQSTVSANEQESSLGMNQIHHAEKGLIADFIDKGREIEVPAVFELKKENEKPVFPLAEASAPVLIVSKIFSEASGSKVINSLSAARDLNAVKPSLLDVLSGSTASSKGEFSAKTNDGKAVLVQLRSSGDRVSALFAVDESIADASNDVTLIRKILVTFSVQKSIDNAVEDTESTSSTDSTNISDTEVSVDPVKTEDGPF